MTVLSVKFFDFSKQRVKASFLTRAIPNWYHVTNICQIVQTCLVIGFTIAVAYHWLGSSAKTYSLTSTIRTGCWACKYAAPTCNLNRTETKCCTPFPGNCLGSRHASQNMWQIVIRSLNYWWIICTDHCAAMFQFYSSLKICIAMQNPAGECVGSFVYWSIKPGKWRQRNEVLWNLWKVLIVININNSEC